MQTQIIIVLLVFIAGYFTCFLSADLMVSVSESWLNSTVEKLLQLEQNQIELGRLSSELQAREIEQRKRSERQNLTLQSLRISLQETEQSLIDANRHIERLTESHEILETSREILSQTFSDYREDRIQTERQMLRRMQIERWAHRGVIVGLTGLLVWSVIN